MSPLPEGTSYHLLLSFLSASLDDGTISMEFMRLHTCACFQVSVRVLFIPPPRPTSPPTLAGGGGWGEVFGGGDGNESVRSSINLLSAVRAARPLALPRR